MADFREKYTTQEKITKDTTGKEALKEVVSNDAFAIGDVLQGVLIKLEQIRRGVIK